MDKTIQSKAFKVGEFAKLIWALMELSGTKLGKEETLKLWLVHVSKFNSSLGNHSGTKIPVTSCEEAHVQLNKTFFIHSKVQFLCNCLLCIDIAANICIDTYCIVYA